MTTLIIFSFLFAWLLVRLRLFSPPRAQLNCGIFGFSGSRPVDVTKLRWLAVENQKRGEDSTGVYGNHLFKDVGKAKEVILTPGFNAAVKGARTIQGHTRAASVGSVNKNNAHPFHFGDHIEEVVKTEWNASVVCSHNGFVVPELLRYYEKKYGLEYCPVDSMVIVGALAKTGDINVISELEGGMALSVQFLSHNPNRLYLYKRENTRPLHIGEASDGIYYSSLEEPLKFIGCRNTWELTPNTLYTLEGGEIVDIYKMPDPVLKSMAANVGRSDWRRGIPNVELSALPENAGSPTRMLAASKETQGASGGSTTPKQIGFGFNNKGFSKKSPEAFAGEYSTKTSIDAKFNLLINNVSKELKLLEVNPITPEQAIVREQPDLACCVLVVNIVDQSNNRGLVAWAVLADGDSDLAGITSGNGVTIIKVPTAKCGKPIKFYAYAPVEEFGPFTFVVTPEATRVVEVTLSIPFLKKSVKKTQGPILISESELEQSSGGIGQDVCPVYPFGTEQNGVYDGDTEQDCGSLRDRSPQISGGSKGQENNGEIFESSTLELAVPETELADGDLLSLERRLKQTMIRLQRNVVISLIDIALSKDCNGVYAYHKGISGSIMKWATELPDRKVWLDYYNRNHINTLRIPDLILDATRLIQRDRHTVKAWYPFWVYIELLLKLDFESYVKTNYGSIAVSAMKQESFYPSVAVRLNLLDKKKETEISTVPQPMRGQYSDLDSAVSSKGNQNIPYFVYAAFLNWLVSINDIRQMTTDKIASLRKYYDTVSHNIVVLNELMADEHEPLSISQKNKLINVRNDLKFEREDLADYIQSAETTLVHNKISEEAGGR